MTLWLRVRRARVIALVVLAIAMVCVAFDGVLIPLPTLGSLRGLEVHVATLAPLAVAITLAWGLAMGEGALQRAPTRPIDLLDTAYAGIVAVLSAALFAACQALALSHVGVLAARDVIGYIGLMLLGRSLLGSNGAALLPVGMILLVAAFGADGSGDPRGWAWPVLPSSDQGSWVFALGAFAAGLVVSATGLRLTGKPIDRPT